MNGMTLVLLERFNETEIVAASRTPSSNDARGRSYDVMYLLNCPDVKYDLSSLTHATLAASRCRSPVAGG